ncbi:PREDICTED: uncharacterized protein LOC105970643 [Erythranthe guttata]|uniref:uncharacterized protein LOC105970643 n=1 Tax=Erythranthe guttata TaxID=4155 RepID=UPI00064D840A|nr:PREDICTED: uncharacterized protein LOC105970643 [Erythranthe guttata]|eukprot:XP_012850929.1 PREDICTED: uncharacterized protein LOC105970643 [Erythranthe guttata]
MSRKGYARMENEMKENHANPSEITRVELWKKAYENKNGEPVNDAAGEIMEQIKKCNELKENPPSKDSIRDDALARVLGPEARGRVRGLGFGATPSRVAATIQSNAMFNDIQTKMANLETQVKSLMKLNQQNSSKNPEDMISSHVATPQVGTPQSEQGSHPLQDQPTNNQKCQLLHWYNFKTAEEVVAEGHIASTDPQTKVHHIPIGKECWKVWVDLVVNEDLHLFRPTNEFSVLGDALGSTIAWPKSSIKMINEDYEYLH